MLSVALRSTAAPHLVRLARPRAARGSSGKPARAYTCDVRRRDALRKSPLPTLPLRASVGPARLLSEGQPFQRTRAYRGGGGFAPQQLTGAGAPCGRGAVLRTLLDAPRCRLPPTGGRGPPGLRLDAWPRSAVPLTGTSFAKGLAWPFAARESARAIHLRTGGQCCCSDVEFARRRAKRRMRPRRTRLEQATLTSEDHDAGERRHHDRYTEEKPNCHGPCRRTEPGRIVTPDDLPARSAWRPPRRGSVGDSGPVPAGRPKRPSEDVGSRAAPGQKASVVFAKNRPSGKLLNVEKSTFARC